LDIQTDSIQPIVWRDNRLYLLDQRRFPQQQIWLEYDHPDDVTKAIHNMVVRGAPAIGITAAYGVVLAARQAWNIAAVNWKQAMTAPLAHLAESRPTAVNLHWAIHHMTQLYEALPDTESPEAVLLEKAQFIHDEDIKANHKMGKLGAKLLKENSVVLTHCNAGALATAGYGTALGVIRSAIAAGKAISVIADETRPFLQGARLTAWELQKDNIPVTLICDNMAGYLMSKGEIDCVIVGADRIAANGDVANKIGTYTVAILAKEHNIPFYVAAPVSTIDLSLSDGSQIPIEERDSREMTHIKDIQLAPEGINVFNPAFDITPQRLVTAIITENGVVTGDYVAGLLKIVQSR